MKGKYYEKSHIIKLIALLLGFVLSACSQAPEQLAEFVYTGGKIYTMNEKQPWAEAIAVKGNQIVYVGDAAGAKAFTGKETKIIDTTGKIVMPGFVDAHDHLIGSGWTSKGVHLFDPLPKKPALWIWNNGIY